MGGGGGDEGESHVCLPRSTKRLPGCLAARPSDPRQCDLCLNLRGYFPPSYCRVSLHGYKILQQKQHPSPIALLNYYSPAAASAAERSLVVVVVVVVVVASAALANTRQHPFYSDLIIIPISVFNSKPRIRFRTSEDDKLCLK